MRTLPLSALGLAALLTCAPLAQTQARPDVADFVPQDSYLALRVAGMSKAKIEAAQHGLVRYYREVLRAPLQEWIREESEMGFEEWRSVWRDQMREFPELQLGELAALLDSPMAIAMGRPTFVGEAVFPSTLIVADVQGREKKVEALLLKVGELLFEEVRGLQRNRAVVRGQEFVRIWHTRAPGEIFVSIREGYLVLGLGRGIVEAALDTARGQRPSITQLPEWKDGKQRLPEDALLQAHINLRAIGQSLEPWLPYEIQSLAKALGIEAIEGLSSCTSRSGLGDVTWSTIRAPGSMTGLLKRSLAEPLQLQSAKLLPENTLFFAAARLQTKGLENALEQLMQTLPMFARNGLQQVWQREILPELMDLREELESEFGPLPWNEILAELHKIGPEFAMGVTLPRPGSVQPGLMVFVESAHAAELAEKLARLIASFEDSGLPKLRSSEKHGTTLYYMSLQKLIGRGITPAFAAVGHQLVFASDRRDLIARLGQLEEGGKSLADVESFKSQVAAMPAASAMTAIHFEKLAQLLFSDLGNPLMMTIQMQGGMSNAELARIVQLLNNPQLHKALGMQVDAFSVDEAGFHWRRHSPLGAGSLYMAAMTVLDWLLEDSKTF
jgi:hypothetical protein